MEGGREEKRKKKANEETLMVEKPRNNATSADWFPHLNPGAF